MATDYTQHEKSLEEDKNKTHKATDYTQHENRLTYNVDVDPGSSMNGQLEDPHGGKTNASSTCLGKSKGEGHEIIMGPRKKQRTKELQGVKGTQERMEKLRVTETE